MKRYFDEYKTSEEIKAAFKKYAKELHPDCGGDAEAFKEMKAQFEQAFKNVGNVHTTKEGKTYTKESTHTAFEYMNIIEKIIHFQDVTIEIMGSWIWVSGNTMTYREQLKELHFFWSKSKRAWYYSGEEKKGRTKGHYSMNKLREHWGSEEVQTEKQDKITA